MKKRLFLISTILIGLTCFIMIACQKDSTTAKSQGWDQNSPEASNVIGLNTFDALNAIADQTFSTNNLKSAGIGDCPSLTLDISQTPWVLTFDWGTGCVGTDSIDRKGKITVSMTGLMNVPESVATFTFIDFYSGGNKITGIHTITYAGLNPGNSWPRFEIHTEGQITYPDGKYITYLSDNVRLLAEGAGTATWTDDVWRIEGTWSGTTREGVNWTTTCNHALVKKATCNWFDSGTLVITPEGGVASTVDFGDGTCDNKATLTIGTTTVNVEM